MGRQFTNQPPNLSQTNLMETPIWMEIPNIQEGQGKREGLGKSGRNKYHELTRNKDVIWTPKPIQLSFSVLVWFSGCHGNCPPHGAERCAIQLMIYNECIMRFMVCWNSDLLPSWASLFLTGSCFILWQLPPGAQVRVISFCLREGAVVCFWVTETALLQWEFLEISSSPFLVQ